MPVLPQKINLIKKINAKKIGWEKEEKIKIKMV